MVFAEVYQPKYIFVMNLVLRMTHETWGDSIYDHSVTTLPLSLSPWTVETHSLTQYIYCKYHLLCNIWSALQFPLISLCLWSCRQMSRLAPGSRGNAGAHWTNAGPDHDHDDHRLFLSSLIFAVMWWPLDPGRYQPIFPSHLCFNTSILREE